MWDRRILSEASPRPVGVLAGHKDGITYIDPKVRQQIDLSRAHKGDKKCLTIKKISVFTT